MRYSNVWTFGGRASVNTFWKDSTMLQYTRHKLKGSLRSHPVPTPIRVPLHCGTASPTPTPTTPTTPLLHTLTPTASPHTSQTASLPHPRLYSHDQHRMCQGHVAMLKLSFGQADTRVPHTHTHTPTHTHTHTHNSPAKSGTRR
jgi:hypothetical protein